MRLFAVHYTKASPTPISQESSSFHRNASSDASEPPESFLSPEVIVVML